MFFLRSASALKRSKALFMSIWPGSIPSSFSRSTNACRPECLPRTMRFDCEAHRFGLHDLVGLLVLENPVLMDAGLVGEGVVADDRLVDRDRDAGDLRKQAARRIDLLGDDTRCRRRRTRPGACGSPSPPLPSRYCRHARRCHSPCTRSDGRPPRPRPASWRRPCRDRCDSGCSRSHGRRPRYWRSSDGRARRYASGIA